MEKEMATLSSILAWRIPWTEEPGSLQELQFTGLQRVRHDWVTEYTEGWVRLFYFFFCAFPCFPDFVGEYLLVDSASEGFPGGSDGKDSACNAGDPSLIPELRRSPGEGIGCPLQYSRTSLVAQTVKNLPAMQEIWLWSLDWDDPLEKGKAGYPLQYSGLENPHGQRSLAGCSPWVTKSWTWLNTGTVPQTLSLFCLHSLLCAPTSLCWWVPNFITAGLDLSSWVSDVNAC